MDEQLRVGLVGAGPWARSVHAPGLADHPGTRLTTVWARRASAAQEVAGSTGATVAADWPALLDEVDAVAFAVPPDVQAKLAAQAAAAGKHLILEKPLALDLPAAERLAGAVAEAGVVGMLMLSRRFAPETVAWLAELRRLGEWSGGDAKWLAGSLLAGDYSGSPWRHEGGALVDIGPHVLDLLDAALGEITGVPAASRTADDLWHLTLDHAGGARSSCTLSMRLPLRPSVLEFAVYGRHGYRALSGRPSSNQECFTAFLDDFVAMVASGTTAHPCDIRRGLHLQRVLETARQRADG
ncbi:putative dehydrogenase [Tamaricihabitans halophyticus]|uniref:Putative dehydrogenase n=1 Tax=Tamaricihabitans halophyticus TaxID=1262583 RepID=A0A4R2R511_9PSEU|nr:Gfo/Idh/MocA family oxidoreductase [Tamaricihabitans halophyticus]TCP56879.1 putative dehydrogenase [Tamaricihabitans halophyticus]